MLIIYTEIVQNLELGLWTSTGLWTEPWTQYWTW